ncbi:MAG TPA: L-arabinose isomerase [Prolixibacteraceae bacterium]|nr:L-arabinose isomerase [Prolixibacteraceae bacterium]
MINLKELEVWFVTGSQDLYGPKVLEQVATNSKEIAAFFNSSSEIPVTIVYKSVMRSPDEITNVCIEANSTKNCIGVITWCHTFSPSKMWINGLKILNKPMLQLHTQFNKELPWAEIDMDFMNLNQAAHGDREHGFILSRLRKNRKVVVGYWKEEEVQQRIGIWSRAASAWFDMQGAKIARFGDNMREVAVTEGDKVEAQIKFGLSVNTWPVGDIVKIINEVSEQDIDALVDEYTATYDFDKDALKGGKYHDSVRYQARIEAGIKSFLVKGGFKAFTTTFEDLHGLKQLPGLASQRLMAAGFGFGAEGDWKHAAMVRAVKVMGAGLKGGCSFMEDYTYHLSDKGYKALGSHMLEICPSIADGKAKIEVHPLGIGGKDAPARLVFNTMTGPATCTSLVDMGNRFRMVVHDVECVAPEAKLEKLPVASALWTPMPNLKEGAAAWIYAGGAHHNAFSQAVTAEYIEDFCEIAGIELVQINKNTNVANLKNELKWNEMYYMLANGLK